MTNKYTRKLLNIAKTTQTPGSKTKTTNVYVNPNLSFKNTKVLAASAKQNAVVLPKIKSVVRLVNTTTDNERISGLTPVVPQRIDTGTTPTPPSSRTTISGEGSEPTVFTLPLGPVAGLPFVPIPQPVPVQALPLPGLPFVPIPASLPFVPFGPPAPTTPLGGLPPVSIPGPLSVTSSLAPGDSAIFGVRSFIDFPVNLEIAEQTSGLQLTKNEKPRILAIINEDVREGYPNKNIVILKKLISNRARVIKYSILRKHVFKDRQFKKVLELQTDDLSIPEKYRHFLKETGIDEKSVFMYIDTDVKPNNTYVYKIEVNWTSTGAPPDLPFVDRVIPTAPGDPPLFVPTAPSALAGIAPAAFVGALNLPAVTIIPGGSS